MDISALNVEEYQRYKGIKRKTHNKMHEIVKLPSVFQLPLIYIKLISIY